MKNYNTYLLSAFIGFMVLTFGIASYSYYKFRTLNTYVTQVKHTMEVIDKAEATLAIIKDVETRQRGYLLTNDNSFLPPFYEAQYVSRKALDDLRQLTTDNIRQQKRLSRLDKQLTRHLQLLEKSAFLYQLDPQADLADSVRLGRTLMDSIRHGFSAVIAEERLLVNKSENQQKEAILNVPWLTMLLSSIAVLILVISYVATRRQLIREQHYKEELHNNNVRLTQQNNELEQFAYITSHDLQEPMRKIQTLSDRILYRHRDASLGDDVKYSLERIRHASERMRLLINDVLQYSRIRTDETILAKPVDLNICLRDALDLLEENIKQKNAIVSASTLPIITGDHTQWVQVFLNLIGNALKFARENEPPRIIIEAQMRDNNGTEHSTNPILYNIIVKDNGIGFDNRYAEKIFQVFQRLHHAEEYPGTGIGLALVNKIVQVHHGKISASSLPGVGTTITIEIPALNVIETDSTDDELKQANRSIHA